MKIIKKGSVANIAKQITCKSCNSELEYIPHDVKSDRDGLYVICPICKKFLAV